MTTSKPIALTPGEPAGIGPDLSIMLAQTPEFINTVVIADPDMLTDRAQQLRLPLTIHPFNPDRPLPDWHPGLLTLVPVKIETGAIPGKPDPGNAHYVLQAIKLAVSHCIDGTFSAIVTGPVHKGVINAAGIPFSGHTEFIAGLTGGHPVMMLATPGLRVALVTTHIPLAEVSRAITRPRLKMVIQTLQQALKQHFSIREPRILVCGLNPHAGEKGHLGREEIDVITPVLKELKATGIDVQGPLPADTLFTPKYLKAADAVLAMYHDQGLPVLKHKGFGKAVNITLGLPIIRTSVDHGTALELAGTGLADTGSLNYAIGITREIINHANKS